MSRNSKEKTLVKGFGNDTVVGYVRWTPTATTSQTLTEAHGVRTITRGVPGLFLINLSLPGKHLLAAATLITSNATHYYLPVISTQVLSTSSKYIQLEFRGCAFADAATTPPLMDPSDVELEVVFYERNKN